MIVPFQVPCLGGGTIEMQIIFLGSGIDVTAYQILARNEIKLFKLLKVVRIKRHLDFYMPHFILKLLNWKLKILHGLQMNTIVD